MVICEGYKVQLWEATRCGEVLHPLPVLAIPARGVDVIIVGQVVQVLYQTTTEADLCMKEKIKEKPESRCIIGAAPTLESRRKVRIYPMVVTCKSQGSYNWRV